MSTRRERRIIGRKIRRRRRIAVQVDAVAAWAGIHLMPWQKQVAVDILAGDRPVVMQRGRRAGWSVVRQIVNTERPPDG